MKITYLKSGYRQPVQLRSPVYPRDLQQDLPKGWCIGCGQMLYRAEQVLCRRCEGGSEYA